MKDLKKGIVLPIAGIMSLSAFAPFLSQEASAATIKEGTVTAHSLTVRSGAGANYKAVDYLMRGDKVTIVSDGKYWDKVSYNGKSGYVYDNYLKVTTRTVGISTGAIAEVTAYSLTFRTGPSPSAGVIGYLKKGTKVTVLENNNGWDKVSYNGKTGYVYDQYLKASSAPVDSVIATKEVNVSGGDRLNVRTGPSIGYKISGKLYDGSKVNVHTYSGDWVYMSYGSLKGWVHGDFLVNVGTSTPTTTPKPEPKPERGSTSVHTVERGDTLWSISRKYDTTVSNIKSLNSLSSNTIYVGQKLKVSGTATSTPTGVLKGKLIVVDPGHGGRHNGAYGYVAEETVNLQMSLKLRDHLESLGADVIMTRTNDTECNPAVSYAEDLACRPNLADSKNADMFISVHSNAGSSLATGTEVFYYPGSAYYSLAKYISDEISRDTGLRNRGAKTADFAVLRHADRDMPSVLIETGFVTNKNDANVIGSNSGQEKIAKAIAEAIVNYYK